jgi:hypothetical protein
VINSWCYYYYCDVAVGGELGRCVPVFPGLRTQVELLRKVQGTLFYPMLACLAAR